MKDTVNERQNHTQGLTPRLTLRIGCAVARKKTFITNKDEGK
jgi:hypothetical protein